MTPEESDASAEVCFETPATAVAALLAQEAPARLLVMRRERAGFESRLRERWGSALDQYLILCVCMEEAGRELNDRWQSEAALDAVLTGLHAKACRVAMEVHTLLGGGFGMGALARCRTLHEMAVISVVIGKGHGPSPKVPDLADQFEACGAVAALKDAQSYQENAGLILAEPLSGAEMQSLEDSSAAAKEHLGDGIGDYAWAREIVGSRRPSFADLEKAAGLDHLRSHYKWASHEVHADARGLEANRVDDGGHTLLMTGSSGEGLADPGQLALISLFQVTTSLLLSGTTRPNVETVVSMQALQLLLDQACETLGATERPDAP